MMRPPRLRARSPRTVASIVACLVSLSVSMTPLPAFADDAACIAASEQALALRKQGKLHRALEQLAVCADPGCPGEVKTECARRVDLVRASMPTLVLAARDTAGNDLLDVNVTMDGAPLATALDGRPLSVDPGPHVFRLEAPGLPPIERQLVLREGEKSRRESVVLGVPRAAPAPPAPPPLQPTSTWSTQRTLALVGGGVGIVGLGLGALFGGYALAAKNDESRDCPSAGCATRPQAVQDYNAAKDNATGSTVAFVAGGALVAAGVVLWLTAPAPAGEPSRSPVASGLRLTPGVGPSAATLVVAGDWQ
jgi:hypothetical protein